MSNIASYHKINRDVLRKHYKYKISGFKTWEQKKHAEEYLIYPENVGPHLSIDEVSLSKGELYTFVTNKEKKGKKGTIVASIKSTKSVDIKRVLDMIPLSARELVKEVTLDMANNMELATRESFPNAILTTDHFHVIKLAMDAMQHLRVKYRWEALDNENDGIKVAKESGVKYEPEICANGDSPKQLLARSKYILAKKKDEWTINQAERAALIFKDYPLLEKAYKHVLHLRGVYSSSTKAEAEQRLNNWIVKSEQLDIKEFKSTANTIKVKKETILNYFEYKSTNANAESFNAKIKLFRANLRGVKDVKFFLFRLEKLFA